MPCAMPRFRWPAGPGRVGRARGAGAAPPAGQGLAVPADRFCERDEVVEHCGCHPRARGAVADEVVDPEAGQPADQVVLARPCQFPAVDALVGGGELQGGEVVDVLVERGEHGGVRGVRSGVQDEGHGRGTVEQARGRVGGDGACCHGPDPRRGCAGREPGEARGGDAGERGAGGSASQVLVRSGRRVRAGHAVSGRRAARRARAAWRASRRQVPSPSRSIPR